MVRRDSNFFVEISICFVEIYVFFRRDAEFFVDVDSFSVEIMLCLKLALRKPCGDFMLFNVHVMARRVGGVSLHVRRLLPCLVGGAARTSISVVAITAGSFAPIWPRQMPQKF